MSYDKVTRKIRGDILASVKSKAPGLSSEATESLVDAIAARLCEYVFIRGRMNQKTIAPFARLGEILKPLGLDPESGVREHIPALWPTVADFLRAANVYQHLPASDQEWSYDEPRPIEDFDRLVSWKGYASGNPKPFLHVAVWKAGHALPSYIYNPYAWCRSPLKPAPLPDVERVWT